MDDICFRKLHRRLNVIFESNYIIALLEFMLMFLLFLVQNETESPHLFYFDISDNSILCSSSCWSSTPVSCELLSGCASSLLFPYIEPNALIIFNWVLLNVAYCWSA